MAQNTVNYANNPTGPELLDDYLAKEQENILSSNSGIQRPSYAAAGTPWIDTSVTPWLYKIYDGSNDAIIGAINPSTHSFIAGGVDETDLVHKTGTETISGTKEFSNSPVIPTPATSDDSTKAATTAYVKAQGYVDLSSSQTITGTKTFTKQLVESLATSSSSDVSYDVFRTIDANLNTATNPSHSKNYYLSVLGSGDNYLGYLRFYYNASGQSQAQLTTRTRNTNNDSNVTGSIYVRANRDGTVVTYAPASDAVNSIVTTIAQRKGTSQNDDGSGYFKLGNGLIIQWGYTAGNGSFTIKLPVSFTSTRYSPVFTNECTNSNPTTGGIIKSKTTSSFTVNIPTTMEGVYWIAIGY